MKTEVKVQKMMMLPPPADKCQECAGDHAPEMPHDASSLFYQMKFNMDNGRFPTWIDAMSHCSQDLKDKWTKVLKEEFGIDVEGGQVRPNQPNRKAKR